MLARIRSGVGKGEGEIESVEFKSEERFVAMLVSLAVDVYDTERAVIRELAGGYADVERVVGEPFGDLRRVAGGLILPSFVRGKLPVGAAREDVEAAGRQGQSLIEDRQVARLLSVSGAAPAFSGQGQSNRPARGYGEQRFDLLHSILGGVMRDLDDRLVMNVGHNFRTLLV